MVACSGPRSVPTIRWGLERLWGSSVGPLLSLEHVVHETDERLRAVAEQIKAAGESSPCPARDPVNLPVIRNWLEAIGDTNPVYTDQDAAVAAGHGGLVAPPAMVQVWTMHGQRGARDRADPTGQMAA